jgi:hypothetical protein
MSGVLWGDGFAMVGLMSSAMPPLAARASGVGAKMPRPSPTTPATGASEQAARGRDRERQMDQPPMLMEVPRRPEPEVSEAEAMLRIANAIDRELDEVTSPHWQAALAGTRRRLAAAASLREPRSGSLASLG